MTRYKLGFLGLGSMGGPIAARLAQAGHDLTVYDIVPAAIDAVCKENPAIAAAANPREVAEASDIVLTILTGGASVRAAVLGTDGLIEGFRDGATLIDMTSSEPALTAELNAALAEKGVAMIDAPVSGGRRGALSGRLTLVMGGTEAVIARCKEVLEIVGDVHFRAGGPGAGHALKTLSNMVSAMQWMATAEAFAIGKRFGLDPELMADYFENSAGNNASLRHFRSQVFTRKFDIGANITIQTKDFAIAMELARETETPVPMAALTRELWDAAQAHEGKDACVTAMVRWIEHLTKTELSPGESPPAVPRG